MSRRLDEARAAHQRYKRDVEERGKPFFPYAMFHDTVMSLVVVAVIIGLSCVWYFTADEEPGEEGAGLLGPLYAEKAEPGTTSFIPRPDWYFYFLFYLLRIFKWPESVILATIGIPTILMVLLFALPFIDLRRERRVLRRPVAVVAAVLVIISMGVLTWKGGTVRESLASDLEGVERIWQEQGNLPDEALPGGRVFAESGCLQCHVYQDAGSPNIGAPELTDIGLAQRGVDYWVRWVRNPASLKPGSQMPPFPNLTEKQLRDLGVFLEASKGRED